MCSSLSSSQQCCYDENGNIVTGTGGGSTYKTYPIDFISYQSMCFVFALFDHLVLIYRFIIVDYLCEDAAPFFLCCTGLFSACNRYYHRRPNDDCSDYPERFPPGTIVVNYCHFQIILCLIKKQVYCSRN